MGITRAELVDSLPMDEDAFGLPEKDIEGTKKKLMLMGYPEDEAARLTQELLRYESNDGQEYIMTDREFEFSLREAVSLDEIREMCPPAYELIKAQGPFLEGAEGELLYQMPMAYLIDLWDLYRDENLDVIKALIALSLYRQYQALFPEARENEVVPDPEQAFIAFVPRAVSEQAFVHNFVPQDRIDMYYSLAEEYREAMRARIGQNGWLDEETKKMASEKLDRLIIVEILYPYGEMDCEPLRTALCGCENLLEASARCREFEYRCLMTFSGREFRSGNRYLSSKSTLESEGMYVPAENAYYIGAAALIGEVCDVSSRETLLGSLGQHIGHELSHGYDTYGARINADGTGPLFVDQDWDEYIKKAMTIVEKLNRIEVLDGIRINGELVIGEVFADLTGLSLSLDLAKGTENFDYDAFFRAYAGFFNRCYASRETMVGNYLGDVHPAPFVRVNYNVAQFDEFYQAYPSVIEGTPMYVAPEDRVLIW